MSPVRELADRVFAPDTEDDRLTVGLLEHDLSAIVERDRHSALSFMATPYQSYPLGLARQVLFPPFSGPADGSLSLVADTRALPT